MDSLRGKYRIPSRDFDVVAGTSSAVLTQTFVSRSIRRERRKDDGLNGFRGALNAVLISLVLWAAIGVSIFVFS